MAVDNVIRVRLWGPNRDALADCLGFYYAVSHDVAAGWMSHEPLDLHYTGDALGLLKCLTDKGAICEVNPDLNVVLHNQGTTGGPSGTLTSYPVAGLVARRKAAPAAVSKAVRGKKKA